MNFTQQFEKYTIDSINNGVRLPIFKIEQKYIDLFKLKPNISNSEFLLFLIAQGFKNKIENNKEIKNIEEYRERIEKEFNSFSKLGLIDYVLITWEIMEFCRESDIATGVGRGSAAGCEIFHLIGITQIDSIKYGCFFERFLNEARCKFKTINDINYYDGSLLMDCDLDISFSDRTKVIEWIDNKYKGHCAKLLTLSTLSTKILLKEVLKSVFSYSEQQANEISEYIPKIFGQVKKISDAISISKDFKNFAEKNPKVIEISKKLYLLNKNFGVHPSAVIISYYPIEELFPLQLTKEKEPITAYSMDDALNLAIKVDILGLRCASLIDRTCKLIGIKSEEIDLNDPIIYDSLKDLKTPHGLFQIEAETNLKVLRQIKPRNLNHLAAVVAIARPGALQFTDQFAKFVKTGESQSVHPFFDNILKNTAGIPIYQEDALRMAHKIGFTLEEAEILRRIIGKKKTDEVKEWKQKIENKVKENNLPKEVSEVFWRLVDESSKYSFNFSHSISYATNCALTVYLKFKYPKEFYHSLLQITKFEPDPIAEISKIQSELPYFNLKLLPPNLLKSDFDFKIENDGIRFGLSYIKGIADKSFEKLNNFRKLYSNKFEIFEAADQAGINIGILSSLIACGCLDDEIKKAPRSLLILESHVWKLLTEKEKKHCLRLAAENNFNLIKILKKLRTELKDEKGEFLIKDKRYATLKKKYIPYYDIYEHNCKREDFCCWFFENQHLGFSFSKQLIDIFNPLCENDLNTIFQIQNLKENEYADFVGEVVEAKEAVARNEKKTRYFRCIIKDNTGQITALLFNDKIDQHLENNARKAEEGDIVIVKGRKKNDSVFADRIAIQETKVFKRLSELKNI